MKIELFYDKECPFCNFYSNYLKLKEKHKLILLNAREYKEELSKLKTKGFDINNGFIIIIDNIDIYQGVDAIVFLNDLAKSRIFFPNNYFFRNIVYPVIKQLRKLILFIIGKEINI